MGDDPWRTDRHISLETRFPANAGFRPSIYFRSVRIVALLLYRLNDGRSSEETIAERRTAAICLCFQTRATATGMHYAVVKQRLDEQLVLDNEVGVALLRRRKAQVHENLPASERAPPGTRRPAIFRPRSRFRSAFCGITASSPGNKSPPFPLLGGGGLVPPPEERRRSRPNRRV